ncbi:MAG: hypothetical protein ABIF19_17070 [Planctomycetota bacterium]
MEAKTEKKRAIPELSVDVKLLYQRIAAMEPGDTISYDDLSGIVYRDIRSPKGWALMASARRKALHDDGIVTECVTNVGVKRMDDVAIIGATPAYIKRVRRAARTSATKIGSIQDYAALSDNDRVQHDMAATALGLVLMGTAPKQLKRIEAQVRTSKSELPTAEAIKLLA